MAVVVRLLVAEADGIEQAIGKRRTLDFEIGVEGVAENEVISVLMAAIARILVMPVAAPGLRAAPPRPSPKLVERI